MEKKLTRLFDYQRFEKNEKLEKLIKQTEERYGTELSDELLSMAAGGLKEEEDKTSLQNR